MSICQSKRFFSTGSKHDHPASLNLWRRRALSATICSGDSLNGANRAHAASSCFVAGTRILMSDGTDRAIEDVKIGDLVIGHGNQLNRVVGLDNARLGARDLYSINGEKHFVTAEHPFMTAQGWKSVDPATTHPENARLNVGRLTVGDMAVKGHMVVPSEPIADGNTLLWSEAEYRVFTEEIFCIDLVDGEPDLALYNFRLDGNNSYHADNYVVHINGGGEWS